MHKKLLLLLLYFCVGQLTYGSVNYNPTYSAFKANRFLEKFEIIAEKYQCYDIINVDSDGYVNTRYHCFDKKTKEYLGCVNHHRAQEKDFIVMVTAQELDVTNALEKSKRRSCCCLQWYINPECSEIVRAKHREIFK